MLLGRHFDWLITFINLTLYHTPGAATPLPIRREVARSSASKYSPPNFLQNYDHNRETRGVVSHRGPYGVYEGHYLPDSSLPALVRGFERYKIAEVDAAPDSTGELIATHDLDRSRQTRFTGAWEDTVFKDLTDEEKEYVIHHIQDGEYSPAHTGLNILHTTTEEQIEWTLACEPGLNLIIDTRKDHAIYGVRLMVRLAHLINQVMIHIYNFGFEDADDFIRRVDRLQLPREWREVNFAIAAHYGNFATMAGVPFGIPDHDAMLSRQIAWLDSFLDSGLSIKAVILVVRGGYVYYDPGTKTVDHPTLGYLTNAEDVTPFAIDWVGKQLIDYVHNRTTLPIFGPANTYAVKKDGRMYIDGLEKGNLIHVDPNTPFGWLFLNGGRPDVIYDAGIQFAMADNPELFIEYLQGHETERDAHLNYPPHNYENFGL